MAQLKIVPALLALIAVFFVQEASALSTRQCNPKVPRSVKYRPSYQACSGKAAVILSGRHRSAFSVVFKKVDHNDRLANMCPDAACSPFKAKKQITQSGNRIICFGDTGSSPVFNGVDPDYGYRPEYVVKWISIKLRNSHLIKDVEIYCLPKPYPRTPLN